jgi:hypothetical protein
MIFKYFHRRKLIQEITTEENSKYIFLGPPS